MKRSDERLTAERGPAEITTKYLPLTECKGCLGGVVDGACGGGGGTANT